MIRETIKGTDYGLIKLPPLQGGRLATQVGQILAGALDDADKIKSLMSAYKNASKTDGEKADGIASLLDSSELLSALAGGAAKIDADALYEAGLRCIRGNLFTTTKLHDDNALNAWFEQHPDHLLLVMAWALKVNCSGFFGLGAPA